MKEILKHFAIANEVEDPQPLKIDFLYRPPYFDVSPTHKARTWLLDPRAPKVDPPEIIKHIQGIKLDNMDVKDKGGEQV